MLTLQELASLTGGVVIGDPYLEINGVSEIQYGQPGTITFVGNPKYKKYISTTDAAAIVVTDAALLEGHSGIVVENPQLAIADILTKFSPVNGQIRGIHPTAVIDENAAVGEDVSIGAYAFIGREVVIGRDSRIGAHVVLGPNTVIGEEVTIHSQVTIAHNCEVGNQAVIQSGTVIGSDGFGYVTENDVHRKIPQNGRVVIEKGVEIGSNCSIDRGTIGDTLIKEGTKIDNLVHIAHNVRIGKGCLITGLVGIAGTVEIGDYCIFAGQAGVAPHLKIGDRTIIAAKTGVTKSLPGGKIYAGMPAREIREQNRRDAVFSEVAIIKKRLQKLEQKSSETSSTDE